MSTALHTAQASLFDTADLLPPGLSFMPDFISRDEEAALLGLVQALPVQQARYHQYTARRRVYTYGARDESRQYTVDRARPLSLPPPMQALRQQLAAWVGIAPAAFTHVMVCEYQPGTPLGWHRDAPHYELIAGVSLGSAARLRFRPWPAEAPHKDDIIGLDLAPRSAYVMRGVARWGWQHSVPPVPALRYSVTMRTPRQP